MRGGALPIVQPDNVDSPDRNVEVLPTKNPSDPRLYLKGVTMHGDTHLQEEQFLSGFFDKNTFVEAMGGWAKTVMLDVRVLAESDRCHCPRSSHYWIYNASWRFASSTRTSRETSWWRLVWILPTKHLKLSTTSIVKVCHLSYLLTGGAFLVDNAICSWYWNWRNNRNALIQPGQPVFVYLPPNAHAPWWCMGRFGLYN